MRRTPIAVAAAALASGCAYVSGPCELQGGDTPHAACEAGGSVIVWKPVVVETLGNVLPTMRPSPRHVFGGPIHE